MPFLAPIGAAIAGAAAATAGAAAVLAPIITVGSGVAGIAMAAGAGRGPRIGPLDAPLALPDPNRIAAQEAGSILRSNQKRTKTILTSPLGVTDQTSNGKILKKTLGGA